MESTEVREKFLKDAEDIMSGKVTAAQFMAADLDRALKAGPVESMKSVMGIFTAVASMVFDIVPKGSTDHAMALLLEDIVNSINRTAIHKTTISVKKLIADNAALQGEVATLRQRCDTLETALGKEEA
jgi:hypothetical protein